MSDAHHQALPIPVEWRGEIKEIAAALAAGNYGPAGSRYLTARSAKYDLLKMLGGYSVNVVRDQDGSCPCIKRHTCADRPAIG